MEIHKIKHKDGKRKREERKKHNYAKQEKHILIINVSSVAKNFNLIVNIISKS